MRGLWQSADPPREATEEHMAVAVPSRAHPQGRLPRACCVSMKRLNAAVLETFAELLRPDLLYDYFAPKLGGPDPAVRRADLAGQLTTVSREPERRAQAVADGGPIAALVQEIRKREHRRGELRQAIAHLDAAPAPPKAQDLDARIATLLREGGWQSLATKHVQQARALLKKCLLSRITVHKDPPRARSDSRRTARSGPLPRGLGQAMGTMRTPPAAHPEMRSGEIPSSPTGDERMQIHGVQASGSRA